VIDQTGTRLFVSEAFEATPALAAGIDRGTEILAIGTASNNLVTVASLLASGGTTALNDALGPSTAGTTRFLQIRDASGTRTVSVTKADYSIDPVSARYGAQVITDNGRKIGYVNLRTFINTADPELRTAFANFKAQGITNVIVDLRYNGGGLVSIAETLANLLGGNRSSSDVIDYLTYRPEKSSNNSRTNFAVQAESVSPVKIAFIGMGGTASASELTINAFAPYLGANSALIGSNTYGKPVGQIAIDRAACDDRLRVIAFAVENSAHQGTYYNGLSQFVAASCQSADDLTYPLGDPREASTRQALNFLAGQSCTAIASSGQTSQSVSSSKRFLLSPDRPDTAQREVPGLY
jgi:C-terminal processing protease CtpA/Prc